ncbi:MAG: protein-L-isoaspartate(D-aspartate) O-methyltransferase [Bacteroidales bacterium]|nr:protein-L-isoaspartate(D-aspartate) O-methyltransferase [Candidatus Colimorpha onthohippi]
MITTDTLLDQGRRRRMCERLRNNGISQEAVLEAMRQVPRHWFMDISFRDMAYEENQAFPIACQQTISQPWTVAFQTQLLDIAPEMKVLEIGTGSGYQTAVLCQMKAKVYTIERQKGLFDATKALLSAAHYRAKCFLGDGFQGLKEVDYGPYDRIIITCGAPSIPNDVVKQLKVGGKLVVPVGETNQQMVRLIKNSEDESGWITEEHGNCKFVPMLQGRAFQRS